MGKDFRWRAGAGRRAAHYRAGYECILFFEKGKRQLNDRGIPDIITAERIHRGYPTENPAEVSEVLIRQSTTEGEMVLDPFVGSGSTGVAAVEAQLPRSRYLRRSLARAMHC